MTVHAPFRFAPIHRWVYFPEWGNLITHDVPFKDGLSGKIAIEIRTETPLLVGGPRRKATDQREGEVRPFRLPDGRYAIPGSALQGMARSILEIAAFGRLGPWIEDTRFGIRDLTEPAKPFYRGRLIGKVQAGFLVKSGENYSIRPCKLRRVKFSDIPVKRGARPQWSGRTTAVQRYEWIASTGPYRVTGPDNASKLLRGDGDAWLVLTGNTGAGGATAKAAEFVFVEESSAKAISVCPRVISDFEFIHKNNDPENPDRWNPTYKLFMETGYPKGAAPKPFAEGGEIPVFYLVDDDGTVTSIGLAYMFKLAHAATTRDLLANSSPAHSEENPAQVDLPSSIFGLVANLEGDAGVKRRVGFDNAVQNGNAPTEGLSNPTILLGPKPNYYPMYVRQPQDKRKPGELPDGSPYATYTPLMAERGAKEEHKWPELAGVKIWPAKSAPAACSFPNLMKPPDKKNRKVQIVLGALPAQTTFVTTLRFHNLRRCELGAVLWALTYGDQAALGGTWGSLRHRIGMGKPHGLGQIAIRLSGELKLANHGGAPPTPAALVDEFERTMDSAYKKESGNVDWRKSVQVASLLRAANPSANDLEVLSYMHLGAGGARPAPHSYIGERRLRHSMPPYATGHELPRRLRQEKAPADTPASSAPTQRVATAEAAPWSPGRRVRDLGGEFGDGTIATPPDDRGFAVVRFRHGVKRIHKDELKPL